MLTSQTVPTTGEAGMREPLPKATTGHVIYGESDPTTSSLGTSEGSTNSSSLNLVTVLKEQESIPPPQPPS